MSGTDRVVGVVGLGYVGLPLAVSFAEAGLEAIGFEADESRIDAVNAGRSPIGDIDDARLVAARERGLGAELATPDRIAHCDAIFVCVPTPVDRAKNPDLTPIRRAARTIAAGLRAGQLIILQSTTYPGTTVGPFREGLEASGLAAGRDFDLAFAPERINPGDVRSAGAAIPRLVGGTTPAATARAKALLGRISDRVIALSSPDAAEMAKLLENIFRNVNIALVNQLALLCERMGVDVWEVIDAAATKPFGFMRFTPGPGVGGHCIPVDPYYLAWRAREFDFVDRFVETAGDVNLTMPRHVVDLCVRALNDRGRSLKGARIGVIGVAFKPDVADARNSPAAAILDLLAHRGAKVAYHDPFIPSFRDDAGRKLESKEIDNLLADSELVLIVTAHSSIDWERVFDSAPLVVDTVNRSRGRDLPGRQVLRLGAGWGTQTTPTGTGK